MLLDFAQWRALRQQRSLTRTEQEQFVQDFLDAARRCSTVDELVTGVVQDPILFAIDANISLAMVLRDALATYASVLGCTPARVLHDLDGIAEATALRTLSTLVLGLDPNTIPEHSEPQ